MFETHIHLRAELEERDRREVMAAPNREVSCLNRPISHPEKWLSVKTDICDQLIELGVETFI